MRRSVKIHRKIAKAILWLSQFFSENVFLLVCKGYDEDDDDYTGLYWRDDKDTDFSDDSYWDFQLWYNVSWKSNSLKN